MVLLTVRTALELANVNDLVGDEVGADKVKDFFDTLTDIREKLEEEEE